MTIKSRVNKLEGTRRKRAGSGVLIVTQCLEPENAGLWHGQAGKLYTEDELDALAQQDVQLVRIVYTDDWRPRDAELVRRVTFNEVFAE